MPTELRTLLQALTHTLARQELCACWPAFTIVLGGLVQQVYFASARTLARSADVIRRAIEAIALDTTASTMIPVNAHPRTYRRLVPRLSSSAHFCVPSTVEMLGNVAFRPAREKVSRCQCPNPNK